MKDEEIIKAVAELDGWEKTPAGFWKKPPGSLLQRSLPPYLTSRGTIVPVIEKQWKNLGSNSFDGNKFSDYLRKLVDEKECCTTHTTMRVLLATPRQICEALLRATGRWKE